jgi:hypothetical protein
MEDSDIGGWRGLKSLKTVTWKRPTALTGSSSDLLKELAGGVNKMGTSGLPGTVRLSRVDVGTAAATIVSADALAGACAKT